MPEPSTAAASKPPGRSFSPARCGPASGPTPTFTPGDGAHWIAGQVEEQFATQGSYPFDFYHVCEYLSAAAKTIVPSAAAQKAWMDGQKDALKTGRLDHVLARARWHIEPPEIGNDSAPVRKSRSYLSDRRTT